jgi:hypothetical protein
MRKVNRKLRESLYDHLIREEEKYYSLGDTVRNNLQRPHTYIDNGAKILGVAHLDFVPQVAVPVFTGQHVVSGQLDDRLGVWVLLDLLPALGAPKIDVLLTTDEEIGSSTAADFVASKEYNWIFSFDRRGHQTVMYDYEDQNTAALVNHYGWDVGFGSFSDICYLDHLGVKGFNFATAYHMEHTNKCYANLKETLVSAKKFCKFAKDLSDTKLEHKPKPKRKDDWTYSRSWNKWIDTTPYVSSWDVPVDCSKCYSQLDLEWSYCPYCGQAIEVYDEPVNADDADWVIR